MGWFTEAVGWVVNPIGKAAEKIADAAGADDKTKSIVSGITGALTNPLGIPGLGGAGGTIDKPSSAGLNPISAITGGLLGGGSHLPGDPLGGTGTGGNVLGEALGGALGGSDNGNSGGLLGGLLGTALGTGGSTPQGGGLPGLGGGSGGSSGTGGSGGTSSGTGNGSSGYPDSLTPMQRLVMERYDKEAEAYQKKLDQYEKEGKEAYNQAYGNSKGYFGDEGYGRALNLGRSTASNLAGSAAANAQAKAAGAARAQGLSRAQAALLGAGQAGDAYTNTFGSQLNQQQNQAYQSGVGAAQNEYNKAQGLTNVGSNVVTGQGSKLSSQQAQGANELESTKMNASEVFGKMGIDSLLGGGSGSGGSGLLGGLLGGLGL